MEIARARRRVKLRDEIPDFTDRHDEIGHLSGALRDMTGALIRRIEAAPEEIEVILALGSDVEGEATANYLAELLRGRNCKLTRIAQGLPAGGGLEHADGLTLLRAMQGRRNL